jgi:uncharacterized protein (TIGR02246 family)
MRKFIPLIPVIIFFVSTGCEQHRKQNQGQDEQAIRNVILQMTDGFNKHDADAATAMYTSDADFVNVRGDKYTGAAEIRQRLAAIFSTRTKNAILKTQNVTIRFINRELAFAHVTNELSGLVDTAGVSLPSHRELSIRVFIKESDNWRVAAFHNTMIKPF